MGRPVTVDMNIVGVDNLLRFVEALELVTMEAERDPGNGNLDKADELLREYYAELKVNNERDIHKRR